MKAKIIGTVLFGLFIIRSGYSQSKKNVFFDQNSLISKFHTIDELEDLKKGELMKLYTERVYEITIVLPNLALTKEAGTKLSDIGIKEDSSHLKILDKHHDITTDAFEGTSELISELVPYADTEKIIWSILYFEEVIKKIRIGPNGNF